MIKEGIVSAIILLIMYIPSAFSQESSQEKEYIINPLGITLKYPSNWNITFDSSSNNKCEPTCLVVLKNINTSNVTLSIYAQYCNCNNLLDRVKDQYTTYLEPQNITLLNDNGTKLNNGINAWQMQYLTGSKNNYVLWFINDGFFYELNYYNNRDLFSKHLLEIKTIVDAIELFPKNTRSEDQGDSIKQIASLQPSFLNQNSNQSFINTSAVPFLIPSPEMNQNSILDKENVPSKFFASLIEYYPAVTLEYIGNNTIALKGDEEFMLKTEYNLRSFWEAIDTIKQFGYNLDEITESGLGSVGNPTRFYAIMSLDTNIDNSTMIKDLSK